MKILIINFHYPPSTTAHSYRWSLLRDYFLQHNHSVDYICGGQPSEYDEENSICRINFPYTIKKNYVDLTQDIPIKKNSIKSKFISLSKYIYRKFFWPDGLWHWLPFALHEVYKRRKVKYDLIIGYSPTFSAIIASYFYKKINDQVKFIVDFGDPFSVSTEMPVNNYWLYGKLNHWVENKIFNSADLVSFTNEATYNLYKSAHPDISNFLVIPHLVNIDDFYTISEPKPSEKYKIGYVGAFHKGVREPNLVIEKILSLQDLFASKCQFNFYGPLNGVSLPESERLKYHGVVERHEALDLMKSFNIIINVENESCPMSPSKIYECMATGKPILNFLSSTRLSSFNNYPLVLNIDEDTHSSQIEKFIIDNVNNKLPRKIVDEILTGKTLSSIGDQYLNLAGD
ncbi:TPA: glycosyl transferase [Escherichia coli]|uniref:glycosyl transferase n=1 Tax=Escherichia coli TaxID=562 RepID=UPI002041A35C|nr:glycosyl transferase [Escherichia coli]